MILAILLVHIPQSWVTLDDFSYPVGSHPSVMGDLGRFCLSCWLTPLGHGGPWTILAILLVYIPQSWVTLDDFGYPV